VPKKKEPLDANARQRIVDLYRAGDLTIGQIAQEVGRSSSTIYYVLDQAGVKRSRQERERSPVTPTNETLAWALERIAHLENELEERQRIINRERESLHALVQLLQRLDHSEQPNV
jgi:transposase-like protein